MTNMLIRLSEFFIEKSPNDIEGCQNLVWSVKTCLSFTFYVEQELMISKTMKPRRIILNRAA